MPVINQLITPDFAAYHADTIELARDMPSESVDFSVFSPPFASLYTYSASERDLGNCRGIEDFFTHYQFLIKEQRRIMRPGRLISIHCMLMPTSKSMHGYIGLQDFRGDIIRAYQKEGFIFHSEVTIWKDPVTAMQRTKAFGLLWKTIKKDSAMSRMGIPDYVVTMRTPGENKSPISHTAEEFPVDQWQAWASPVWNDINPSDTLQYLAARTEEDERHICPLQLGVIRRCVGLWSKSDDLVWSPFMGIGSEGHVALQMGRRFVGAELKDSYFAQACKNLQAAKGVQADLFEQPRPPLAQPAAAMENDDSWDDEAPTAEEEVGQTRQSTIDEVAKPKKSKSTKKTKPAKEAS
jgi:DNA modification methylase